MRYLWAGRPGYADLQPGAIAIGIAAGVYCDVRAPRFEAHSKRGSLERESTSEPRSDGEWVTTIIGGVLLVWGSARSSSRADRTTNSRSLARTSGRSRSDCRMFR